MSLEGVREGRQCGQGFGASVGAGARGLIHRGACFEILYVHIGCSLGPCLPMQCQAPSGFRCWLLNLQLDFWNSFLVSDKVVPKVDQFIFPPRWIGALSSDPRGVGDTEAISYLNLERSRGFVG